MVSAMALSSLSPRLPTDGSMSASASRSVQRMETYCEPLSQWCARPSVYVGCLRSHPPRQPPEKQRKHTDRRAQQAHAPTARMGISDGATDGPQAAADCIKQHVQADQPTVGFGARSKDQALVGHVQRLATQVEQHNSDHQRPQ